MRNTSQTQRRRPVLEDLTLDFLIHVMDNPTCQDRCTKQQQTFRFTPPHSGQTPFQGTMIEGSAVAERNAWGMG
jgi:hypothetical protein